MKVAAPGRRLRALRKSFRRGAASNVERRARRRKFGTARSASDNSAQPSPASPLQRSDQYHTRQTLLAIDSRFDNVLNRNGHVGKEIKAGDRLDLIYAHPIGSPVAVNSP